ncbi:MAG TPA: alpha/beta hydrolase, partial [Azospirillaceae bacterium]|nr:alpha/beta hydrolase [Azospirillaceae bacterium]
GNRLPASTPALFIVGDRDGVIRMPGLDKAYQNLEQLVPGLRRKVVVPGAGHWIQQEAPEAVNGALLSFLREIVW